MTRVRTAALILLVISFGRDVTTLERAERAERATLEQAELSAPARGELSAATRS